MTVGRLIRVWDGPACVSAKEMPWRDDGVRCHPHS